MAPREIVIVGAGEAGARAAIALREQGFDGELTLVGEEAHAPYERPPLSKAAIVSETLPALPAIADAARLADIDVTRIAGVAATRIDRSEKRLRLGDGRALAYDNLVLATGARARQLAIPGAELALALRSYDDALRLRERFRAGGRIAIVGGGFIGLELAASARTLGCDVVVIEAAPRVLGRAVPAELAAFVDARHRREGVEIFCGVGVAGFARESGRSEVWLSDQRRLLVDTIVVGVGASPETKLAADAGLSLDNGISTDSHLTTSDPAIHAIGDCASFPHGLFDGRRLRLEAWRNAFDQGAYVARVLMGSQEPFVATPWFWSDQYDLTLQIAGLPDAGAASVRRDLGEDAFLLFSLAADGRLVGAGGVGPIGKVAKDVRVAELLIARRACPDPAALASANVKLKALLTA